MVSHRMLCFCGDVVQDVVTVRLGNVPFLDASGLFRDYLHDIGIQTGLVY